ncbi:MAG TPA: hypothetical protein V6D17_01945 [Candidatus Obscuribacterales bacterium]
MRSSANNFALGGKNFPFGAPQGGSLTLMRSSANNFALGGKNFPFGAPQGVCFELL